MLDETISADFDNELKENEKIKLHKRILCSDIYKEFYESNWNYYYKISSSINKVKNRLNRL